MDDEKKDLSVKTIKEKYHNWEIRHLWATRFLEYVLLFVAWLLIFYLIFSHYSLFNTEAASARYMLSALVQSQAAIVAIVVSLTLIAVQLSASAYSPRVIDIFKKNPDMWILLGFYGLSIFYGLFILKLLEGAEGDFVSQSAIWPSFYPPLSLEHGVSFAYWLGAFTFVILISYMLNIMDLLKPENIINRLSKDISRDKLLKYLESAKTAKESKTTTEDPIQPIMDIVHGSIMKYDIATTRAGLKVVTGQLTEIIDQDSQISISSFFLQSFNTSR
jgi:uncharacterized membrane protein